MPGRNRYEVERRVRPVPGTLVGQRGHMQASWIWKCRVCPKGGFPFDKQANARTAARDHCDAMHGGWQEPSELPEHMKSKDHVVIAYKHNGFGVSMVLDNPSAVSVLLELLTPNLEIHSIYVLYPDGTRHDRGYTKLKEMRGE